MHLLASLFLLFTLSESEGIIPFLVFTINGFTLWQLSYQFVLLNYFVLLGAYRYWLFTGFYAWTYYYAAWDGKYLIECIFQYSLILSVQLYFKVF